MRGKAILCGLLVFLSGAGLASVGCQTTPPAPLPEVEDDGEVAARQRAEGQIAELQAQLRQRDEELAASSLISASLTTEIEELRGLHEASAARAEELDLALASLEERYAALEVELSSAVEEVLRSMARVRAVESRPLAISRISEVRVQFEAISGARDPEVAARVARAQELLSRADAVLAEGNFGGALFLAERANDLVRQARTIADLRTSTTNGNSVVIPIVPSRPLEVLENANLREGPGVDRRRVGGVRQGDSLVAMARSHDWFQVETESGLRAWIHETLVR